MTPINHYFGGKTGTDTASLHLDARNRQKTFQLTENPASAVMPFS